MNSNGRRNNFFPTGFSIRRFIVQSARAAHASPPIGQRSCDIEKGNFKHDRKFNVEGNLTSGNSNSSKSNNIESTSQTSSSRTSSQTLIQNSQQQQQNQQQQQTSSILTNNNESSRSIASTSYIQRQNSDNSQQNICPICLLSLSPQSFFTLLTCNHKACRLCLERYLKNEINESRTDIACPQCSEAMHPSNIEILLKDFPEVINKYEDFMVRRFLLADPDSRWCPAPDCSYAVIASGCASCPRLRCQRPGCGLHFCYHCKAEWHPDQTCDAARASRQSPTRVPSGSTSQDSQHRDDIKPCPRCQVLIVKMDDGSCNHMVCSVCGSEFCWLCMKEISDLHYLSPSGCTFWGKKPWSRKKKLLWQLGILVGAPVGIALVAGIAVPAMIIGIPVWVGKKIYARYKSSVKHKRNCAVLAGVATSILISPVLAGLVVAIGVPILLFYVYGVVPVSLCRAGCGVSTTRDGFKFDFDDETDNNFRNQGDGASADAVSRIGATSIGEVSLSVASGSHIGVSAGHNIVNTFNRESTTALAGSITGNRLEIQADVSSSETASAVTCVSEKSGNTLNDTASTKALAGSILSGKQQLDSSNISEDGISEKVRFDNTVSLISDTKKDNYDTLLSTNQSDQEFSADKTSIGSSHSHRSSEKSFRDELDPATVTGTTSSTAMVGNSSKRLIFGSRIPKLNAASHKTLSLDSATSVSNNIPENVSLEQEAEEEEEKNVSSKMLTDTSKNFPENSSISVAATVIDLSSATKMSPTITTTTAGKQQQQQGKFTTNSNQSKSSLLRNLFFSQSGNDATNNVNRPEESLEGTK